MPDQHFPALERLIQQANRAVSRKPDTIELLASMIKLATDDGADPYLVLGVLIEGAARTAAKHIPPERQIETTEQLKLLLLERLRAHGLP